MYKIEQYEANTYTPGGTGCSQSADEKFIRPLYVLGGGSQLDYPLHRLGFRQVICNDVLSELPFFVTDLFLLCEKEELRQTGYTLST